MNSRNDMEKIEIVMQARLAQSVERETLNLNVVGSSPTLGGIFFLSSSIDISLSTDNILFLLHQSQTKPYRLNLKIILSISELFLVLELL